VKHDRSIKEIFCLDNFNDILDKASSSLRTKINHD
jgi:hypothetical protein